MKFSEVIKIFSLYGYELVKESIEFDNIFVFKKKYSSFSYKNRNNQLYKSMRFFYRNVPFLIHIFNSLKVEYARIKDESRNRKIIRKVIILIPQSFTIRTSRIFIIKFLKQKILRLQMKRLVGKLESFNFKTYYF